MKNLSNSKFTQDEVKNSSSGGAVPLNNKYNEHSHSNDHSFNKNDTNDNIYSRDQRQRSPLHNDMLSLKNSNIDRDQLFRLNHYIKKI